MKQEKINSNELIDVLVRIKRSKKFKKPKILPEFTIEEVRFIRDLIYFKPKTIVFFYLAKQIAERTEVGKAGFFNSRGFRKYRFFQHYIENLGNATKAAIAAGYSSRSARQQGHRVVKEIQLAYQAARQKRNADN